MRDTTTSRRPQVRRRKLPDQVLVDPRPQDEVHARLVRYSLRGISMESSSIVWRKSSRSSGGTGVEVASVGADYHVRDSKEGDAGAVLAFESSAWAEFLAGVRAGRFDTPRSTL